MQRLRSRFLVLIPLGALLALAAVGSEAQSSLPAPAPNCQPNGGTVPNGQSTLATDDPQVPLWCYPLAVGPTTRVSGQNDWLDDFESGGGLQRFDHGDLNYGVFAANSPDQGQPRIATKSATTGEYFSVDIADTSPYRLSGGVLTSPQRSFTFEGSGDNRRLVVEADMTAGNNNTGGADVFYELDVSPAPAPTGITVDPLYGYGAFGGAGAVGCRFQSALGPSPSGVVGETVCSYYNSSTRDAGGADVTCNTQPACPGNGLPGRVWETQGAGGPMATVNRVYNVSGENGSPVFWRHCLPNAGDGFCFDRFRLELGRDFLLVYVNGALQRELRGITTGRNGQDGRIPDSWLSAPGVSVYYVDWINGGQHATNRYFWDRLAVNPHLADGSAAPRSVADSFCPLSPLQTCSDGPAVPTVVVASTGTPVVPPSSTPVATSTAVVASTSTPSSTATTVTVPTMACRVSVELAGTPGPYRPC